MLAFQKVHGLGNDFVLIERLVSPKEAVALCDRRFGIGADGVLMLLAPETSKADGRMRILNADGSEAEMCGNGIRCVAKALYDSGRARKDILEIETLSGLLACAVQVGANGHVDTVAVEMGKPEKIRPTLDEPVQLGDRAFKVTSVSMGNPHAVTFLEPGEALRPLAETYGPTLERHAWFEKRTNAEFACVRGPREIELVVWERGCGITLACGTGACATAAAAVFTGRAPAGEELTVSLPGGSLGITVAKDLGGVRMRGPARTLFTGEIDLKSLV